VRARRRTVSGDIRSKLAKSEAFVREINTFTRKWDLLRPYSIKPGYVGK
jgi:hypothetical protein